MRVRVHLFALLSLVLARLLSSTRAQQQAFTNDLYRVSGSGPSNTTQMLGALVSAANETYSEADGAQIQLNSYSSCASAPDLMLTTPPPPATPPPPGSIVVNIGRKMLALTAPPAPASQPAAVSSLAASQCWDLNITVLLATSVSASQAAARQTPDLPGSDSFTRLQRLDALSSQQGVQVAWVAMQTQLVSSMAYFQLAGLISDSQNATRTSLQLSGAGVVPFTVAKQTLLLSYLQSSLWSATNAIFGRITDFNEAGSAANITLVTLFSQNASSPSYQQVLGSAASSGALATGLTAAGLAVDSAALLSSQSVPAETLLGQAQAILASNSSSAAPVAAAHRKSSGLPTGALAGIIVGAVAASAAVAGLAAFLLLRGRRRHREASPDEPSDSPQKGVVAPWTGSTPPDSGFSSGTLSKGTSKGSQESQVPLADNMQGLQSRAIDAAQVLICRHPDGSEWLLGQGSFGTVFKGQRLGPIAIDVAVKRLRVTEPYQMSQFRNEVNTLKVLRPHNHLVQFHGACLDHMPPMLVMEYLAGGDLRGALSSEQLKGGLTWYSANASRKGRKLAMDITDGLAWLHMHKIIHSDLKTQNVLLTEDLGTAKIGDVGLSRVLHTTYTGNASNNVGTFTYAAPEAILGEKCDHRMDLWSLGVVLWELVTHEMPRRGQLRQLKTPAECPASIAALVDRCMLRHARSRPSAIEVLHIIRSSPVGPDEQADEAPEEAYSHRSGSDGARSDGSNDLAERSPATGNESVSSQPGSLKLRADGASLPPNFSQERYDGDMQDHPAAVRSILTRPSAEMVEWARQENEYADRHGPQQELLTTEDLQNFRRLDLEVEAEASGPSCSSIRGMPGMEASSAPSPSQASAWASRAEPPEQTYQISVPVLPPEEPEPEGFTEPELLPQQGGEVPFTHPFLEQRTRSGHRKASHGSSRKNSRRASSFKSGERQEIEDSVKFETHSEKMDEMLAQAGFGKRRDPENVFASFCGAPAPAPNPTLDSAHDDEASPDVHMPMQRQASRRPHHPLRSGSDDAQTDDDSRDHPRGGRLFTLSNGALLQTPGLLSTDAESQLLSSNLQSSISDMDAAFLRSKLYSAY